MDVNALRLWGIAVSAALMTGALVLAVQPQTRADALGVGAFEIAQADAAGPVGFLIRFQGGGPIARAQAQAARGDMTAAQQQIEIQLQRQQAFAGLCFERFTLGAAEVVLRTCDAIAASERAGVSQTWLARLRAMRAVAYVDANTTVAPGRAG